MTFSVKKCVKGAVSFTGSAFEMLDAAGQKLSPLTAIPFVGDTIADLRDLVSMLNDYYHGRYKKVPATVLLGTAVIIAYIASPHDILPDKIPVIGAVDDIVVIQLVMQFCMDKELKRYRLWRAAEDTDFSPERRPRAAAGVIDA